MQVGHIVNFMANFKRLQMEIARFERVTYLLLAASYSFQSGSVSTLNWKVLINRHKNRVTTIRNKCPLLQCWYTNSELRDAKP